MANGGLVESASGYDIVFSTDAGGAARLKFERVFYDPVTGTVEFHVKIPSLSSSVDTTIYVCYGDAALDRKPW